MLRVLIVDDSRAARDRLRRIVAEAGFLPVEASSAEEAFRLALADPPDVAVVDHLMPGTSGALLVRLLKASADPRVAQVPVVGISGRSWSEPDLQAAGTCCFVPKPVEPERLRRAIRWAFDVYGRAAA
jgi:DNA-binding response OmpR family regulator